MGWVVLGVVILIVIWAIAINNQLVTLRNRSKNADPEIEVRLKGRHDLIPTFVESAKGRSGHERETLEAVVQARGNALSAAQRAAAAPGEPPAMQGLAQAEGALGGALGHLLAVFESYPELKANESVAALQEGLSS